MDKGSQVELEDGAQSAARDQVREFISGLLQQGMNPQRVAEELSYTAVEMSLQLADNKLCVMPILMSSMAQAAQAFGAYQADQKNVEVQVDPCEATNATFH